MVFASLNNIIKFQMTAPVNYKISEDLMRGNPSRHEFIGDNK